MADVAALHQEMFECVQARDFERMRELYHPDYQYTGPDGSVGGPDEAVAMARGYTDAFGDLTLTINQQFACGQNSCIQITARGTHTGQLEEIPATGKAVALNGCNVIEERDGLVYREADYFDSLTLLKQLGVMD